MIIETNNQPVKLICNIKSESDFIVGCLDAACSKRLFFSLAKSLRGSNLYTFRLPLTSKKIELLVDGNAKIENIESTFLNLNDSVDCDPIFLDFIELFAYNACWLKRGTYTSDKYRIDLKKDLGHTPCRIDINTGIIEFSQKHLPVLTVPRVIMLLLHEYAHLWLNANNNDEFEADRHAIEIYLSLGHILHEGVEAFASIFTNTAQNRSRLTTIIDIFKQYDNQLSYEK